MSIQGIELFSFHGDSATKTTHYSQVSSCLDRNAFSSAVPAAELGILESVLQSLPVLKRQLQRLQAVVLVYAKLVRAANARWQGLRLEKKHRIKTLVVLF